MADFMVSYASTERDATRDIVKALRARGYTVWMDSAARDAAGTELPGVPSGQEHWATICAAIDESSTFLVIESPAWHRSEYCIKEFSRALEEGKRYAVVTLADVPKDTRKVDLSGAVEHCDTTRIPKLLSALAPGDDLAATHARLLSELNATTTNQRSGHAQIVDAQKLSSAELSTVGLNLNPSLSNRVEQLLQDGQKRRLRLRAGTVTLLIILLALTVTAVIARNQANANRALAKGKADYASSLSLAQQSRTSNTTADSIERAKQGIALDRNAATTMALRAAEANSYRSTTEIPAGVPAAAAISNDGRTTLVVQGHRIFIVDAPAGRARTVPVAEGTSHHIAVSPDGRTGYFIDGSGVLNCLDVRSGALSATPQQSVVSLNLGSDGVLWWLTRDGRLYRFAGCPRSESNPVASGVAGTIAILVAQERHRLFALTVYGMIDIYNLPVHGSLIGTPLKEIRVSDVPVDGNDTASTKPDTAVTNEIIRCGNVIHVLAGFKSALFSDSHVALNLDGDVIGKRTSSLEMSGIGCTPDDQAWASPIITPHAIALPSSAAYPADEIDARDRGGLTVLANSPDSSHTAVVHTDGRVDVLTVDRVRWSDAVGNAAVAIPLKDGTITVSEDGIANLRSHGTSRQIAQLGAEPVPTTASTTSTAFVAAGHTLFALNSSGIWASEALPGLVTSFHMAAGNTSLVVSGKGFEAVVRTDLSGEPTLLKGVHLPNGEEVSSTTIDGDHEIIGTDYGRVVVVQSGRITASVNTGVAGVVQVRVLPDHDIIAVGGSGTLNRYSPDLRLKASHMFGPSALYLQVSADGSTLLVSLSGNFSVWAVDSATLQPITKVATRVPDVRLVNLGPDGSMAIQLIRATNQTDRHSRLITTRWSRS